MPPLLGLQWSSVMPYQPPAEQQYPVVSGGQVVPQRSQP